MTRALAATVVLWAYLGVVFVAWRGTQPLTPGDDWTSYAEIAVTVAHGDWTGGLAATGAPGGRWWHGTFLYPYLLAPFAFLFPLTWWQDVYWLQYVSLGLTVAGLGWLGGWRVLVLANLVALLDVALWYPTRLLSENLLLPLLPLVFLAARAERGMLFGAGLAAIALTRQNLLLFAVAALGFPVWRALRGRVPRRGDSGQVIRAGLGFAAVYSLLPLHEWWVTGFPWPVTAAGYGAYRLWVLDPWAAVWSVGHNLAFMAGFPGWVDPAYRIRPHWPLLWLLVVWGWRRAPALLRLYVVLYVAVMAATPVIGVYGFRHLIGLTMVLPLFAANVGKKG